MAWAPGAGLRAPVGSRGEALGRGQCPLKLLGFSGFVGSGRALVEPLLGNLIKFRTNLFIKQ